MEAAGLAKIGAAVSAVGTVVGTMANMQAASYQAAVAARNAEIMEMNARREIDRAQVETQDYGEKAREQIGALIASQGASGISLQSGSPMLRQRSAERLAQRDAFRLRSDTELAAERMRQGAADARADAEMARSRRSFSLLSGIFDTGSTLIGGARQVQRIRGMQG